MLQEGEQDVFQKPTWQPEPLCGTKCQSGSGSLLLPCDAVSLGGERPLRATGEARPAFSGLGSTGPTLLAALGCFYMTSQ